MDGGDGFKTMECTYCHRAVYLKMAEMVNLMLSTFCRNLKKGTKILLEEKTPNYRPIYL